MKHILITALFCLLAKILYAQDLIVTDDGDSINCKITKVKADHIYFTFKHKEDVRSTLISVENVDRKSTRLNSSHVSISYAVFCLKKKIHLTEFYLNMLSYIQ